MPEQLENASEESGGDDEEDDNTTDDDGTTVCDPHGLMHPKTPFYANGIKAAQCNARLCGRVYRSIECEIFLTVYGMQL